MKICVGILTILMLLASTCLFAVEIDSTKCERSKVQAQADLKHKKVYFMLQGGIAPIHVVGQELFEQKYQVKYFDLGCVVPSNFCLAHYNAEVAKHLDKTYGKVWRKGVRKDVLLNAKL